MLFTIGKKDELFFGFSKYDSHPTRTHFFLCYFVWRFYTPLALESDAEDIQQRNILGSGKWPGKYSTKKNAFSFETLHGNYLDPYCLVFEFFVVKQAVKGEVETVIANSVDALKDVRGIVTLDAFTDEDSEHVRERRKSLRGRISKLSEKADEKFNE